MPRHGRHIEIRGVVQGVGFRPWVYQLATREHVTGSVRNDSTGVVIDVFGDDDALSRFTDDLEHDAPPAARVREIAWRLIPFEPLNAFTIAESEASPQKRVTIPPDLATCGDCLTEVFDPHDRRYLYPFTNCTNCGPRYSIVTGAPYDRAKTTMRRFVMCDDCRREYEDPLNRRFHAQPNACPKCGPRLSLVSSDGTPMDAVDPLSSAARALRAQLIVAVKGLGGFHLACDATSSTAVQRLRDRKRREVKPLAVMVRDVEQAESLAIISETERALLTSVERLIVLVQKRVAPATSPAGAAGSAALHLAPEVSGDNPLVGLFLPYTPLHHILMSEVGRPLVMTSGNISDEPMVYRDRDAFADLGSIADLFLTHNREIESRVDDSVVRVIDRKPVLFRRSRGYVPRGIELGAEFHQPILAVGAHLKNTFCITSGKNAYLGPHIGDLESVETLRSFEDAIEKMKEFVGVNPALIAHDLHPDYFSTRYALAQDHGIRTIGVQHHHAHIAAVMAEHGLTETTVGIAYDGTGFGTDGTSWGGEILICEAASFRRFATFRPIPLAGGDHAVRQVWRIALAMLDDAFDGVPPLHQIPLFRSIPIRGIESVRRMISGNVNAPRARGVGRIFDALGAIGLDMPHARYEGEVAFLWNVAADHDERGVYPIVVRDGVEPWEIDPRPMIKAAVIDLLDGVLPSVVSARFHNTLAEVTIEVARAAAVSIGDAPIALGGGCFQNARLTESIVRALGTTNCVFMNHEVPPGDGGIALGQAVIADALARHVVAGIEAMTQTGTEVPACV
ncbi:MAG TPA: carbamoyltransferase HypF [Thermoanaerobaculia bacterium]